MRTPFVDIHTHHHNNIDNESIIEIRNIDVDNIVDVDVSSFYSLGIHPWKLDDRGQMSALKEVYFQHQSIVAIGETGIDRLHKDTLEQQKELFLKHIEMSDKYHKPLIIHAVRSYSDIIATKKETKASSIWIIHGFQGNEQSARQLLAHGCYLSLGELLLRDEVKALKLLNMIPKDKLFLETDDSHRNIIELYERVCRLTSIDIEELKSIIYCNYIKVFDDI